MNDLELAAKKADFVSGEDEQWYRVVDDYVYTLAYHGKPLALGVNLPPITRDERGLIESFANARFSHFQKIKFNHDGAWLLMDPALVRQPSIILQYAASLSDYLKECQIEFADHSGQVALARSDLYVFLPKEDEDPGYAVDAAARVFGHLAQTDALTSEPVRTAEADEPENSDFGDEQFEVSVVRDKNETDAAPRRSKSMKAVRGALRNAEAAEEKAEKIVEEIIADVPEAVETVEETAEEIITEAPKAVQETVEAVEETAEEIIADAPEAAQETVETVEEITAEASEAAQETVEAVEEKVEEIIADVPEAAQETAEAVEETAEAATEEIITDASEAAQETVEAVEEKVEEITADVPEAVQETAEAVEEKAEAAVEVITADAPEAVQETVEVVEEKVEEITADASEAVQETVEAVEEKADVVTEEILTDVPEAVQETVEKGKKAAKEKAEKKHGKPFGLFKKKKQTMESKETMKNTTVQPDITLDQIDSILDNYQAPANEVPAPAEEPAPNAEPAPAEEAAPNAEPAPAEQPAPVEEPAPNAEPTPVEEAASTEDTAPAAEAAPAEEAAPVTETTVKKNRRWLIPVTYAVLGLAFFTLVILFVWIAPIVGYLMGWLLSLLYLRYAKKQKALFWRITGLSSVVLIVAGALGFLVAFLSQTELYTIYEYVSGSIHWAQTIFAVALGIVFAAFGCYSTLPAKKKADKKTDAAPEAAPAEDTAPAAEAAPAENAGEEAKG